MASHKHLALLALWFFALISGKARAQPDNLSSDIQEALEGASVPAIKGHGAVAVALGIDSEGTVTVWGQGAYGTTRFDANRRVAVGDQFLVASCGKSFTAAVFGVLVTQGLVKWTDTIGKILEANEFDISEYQPTFMGATVLQLLQHRAGFEANSDFSEGWPEETVTLLQSDPKELTADDRTNIRREFSLHSFTEKPAKARGQFLYSNIGYNVAAWLSEVVSGKNWEDQIVEYFGKPLKLRLGFGLPYDQRTLRRNKNTGPVGQQCTGDGKLSLPDYDWEAYSPYGNGAGGIYMRIGDLATWAAWHVRGFKGLLPKKDYGIISRQAFIRLHTPFRASAEDDSDNNYAGGWYRNQNPNRINHDGSYANFRSKMTGVFQEDGSGNTLAVAVSTNINDDAEGTCTDAVGAILNTLTDSLIAKYLPDVSGSSRRRAALSVVNATAEQSTQSARRKAVSLGMRRALH